MNTAPNPQVKPYTTRYFDPVKRRYYRINNLFGKMPECNQAYPNQVKVVQRRYYDPTDGHYYKTSHLFGLNPCQCGCGGSACGSVIIASTANPCSNPTDTDNIYYNQTNCTYYKLPINTPVDAVIGTAVPPS